ncbi:MAG: NfeD family protein [Lentisphaeria bacterium]|nr:NfeD family protein [Lentisphaeria bacterium]
MIQPLFRWSFVALIITAFSARSWARTGPESPVPAADEKTVFVLPLDGPIDKSLMMVFRRAFREVERIQPDALILVVNTPGGGLRETKEIGVWLLSQKIPVYTFINTDALSAGAILSFATDKIYMHPSATIGSALPILMKPGGGVEELPENVEEKILSATRSLVKNYAQQKGHNDRVAMAMVDPSLEVKIGDKVICPAGKLLNLTAMDAAEVIPPSTDPVLSAGTVDSLDGVLELAGLGDARRVRFEEEPAETLARFIVALGPMLFTLGILGVFIELKTPGFGIPGICGIACLAVFFFGHYVAGLAGLEDIVLVMIGLFLLALEIFVIPGFGIAGFTGILLISVGTVMGMMPHLPTFTPQPTAEPFDMPGALLYLQGALAKFTLSIFLSLIGAWLLSLWLPKTKMYGQMVLSASLSHESGYVSHDDRSALLGRTGVAGTLLRPAGIAFFGDQRVDVVTTGECVKKGAPVRVVDVSAGRTVVEEIDNGC